MSYREDFIAQVKGEAEAFAALAPRMPPDLARAQARKLRVFARAAHDAERAVVLRLSGAQSQVFLDTPMPQGQDYLKWLRLPFACLYVHPESPMTFTDYLPSMVVAENRHELAAEVNRALGTDPEEVERLQALAAKADKGGTLRVRGAIVTETPALPVDVLTGAPMEVRPWGHEGEPWPAGEAVERTLTACLLMPVEGFPLNLHACSVFIGANGTLGCSVQGVAATRRRLIQWLVHLVNFLSSPSVKLAWSAPPAALQKARARRGKPPLPGWYEIVYRRQVREYHKDKFATRHWEHSFRYDVRAHPAVYTRGPMAGRCVWIPAHQRGLKNALYRPKGYRAPGVAAEGGMI